MCVRTMKMFGKQYSLGHVNRCRKTCFCLAMFLFCVTGRLLGIPEVTQESTNVMLCTCIQLYNVINCEYCTQYSLGHVNR